MNYWDDKDYDNWTHTLSSGGLTTNTNDHLDTKVKIPTKDIDINVDKEDPHEDDFGDIWYDAKSRHKPFHLTIDHQTIGHREKGRQHQVMFTSQTEVDAMLSNLDWDELVG